jgi:hypothetical protein
VRDYGINGQIGAERDLDQYIVDLTAIFAEVRRVSSAVKVELKYQILLSDGEGFEPSVPCGTHAFQACPIDRSGTHPIGGEDTETNRSVLQLIFRGGFHCGDTENHQANGAER